MKADVVVIGGGVMGLFIARALAGPGPGPGARAGAIVVLERRELGAGSSGKSGAILRQHYSHPTTVRMARESLLEYRSFAAHTGRDIGFRQTGMVFVCHADDRAALEANVALQRDHGVDVGVLEAPALRALDPRASFRDDVVGALETEAGYVEPLRVLAAVAAECRRLGVDVRTQCPVTDVRVEGGHVRGVRTADGGAIDAPIVVNAGGPWASILCRRLGVDLPLTAIRPQQAYFAPAPGAAPERFVYGDLLAGVYWKPEPAGWTRVGMLSYDGDERVADPDRYDEGVSDAFIQDCRARIASRIPEYAHAVSWGGAGALYTITPDAHPLVGPVPGVGGLFIASGFSGHGFKLGPSIGRGVAAMIAAATGAARDGARSVPPAPMAFDPEFFAPDRFARGQAVTTSYGYRILG
jgi:glycine/D-amino acid oxidase-like deaminating enzyme